MFNNFIHNSTKYMSKERIEWLKKWNKRIVTFFCISKLHGVLRKIIGILFIIIGIIGLVFPFIPGYLTIFLGIIFIYGNKGYKVFSNIVIKIINFFKYKILRRTKY